MNKDEYGHRNHIPQRKGASLWRAINGGSLIIFVSILIRHSSFVIRHLFLAQP
jgi:hypothetical protein